MDLSKAQRPETMYRRITDLQDTREERVHETARAFCWRPSNEQS